MTTHDIISSERERVARFSIELIKVRVRTMLRMPVRFLASTGHAISEAEFERWCAGTSHSVRLTLAVTASAVEVSGSTLSDEETRTLKRAASDFQGPMARLASTHGGSDCQFIVEGGLVALSLREFLNWLEDFDIGELGWVGGNWVPRGVSGNWTFVISPTVAHLDSQLKVRLPPGVRPFFHVVRRLESLWWRWRLRRL